MTTLYAQAGEPVTNHVLRVDTVADLRLLTPPPSGFRQVMMTEGKTTAGTDSERFYWDETSTATDDGSTVVKPSSLSSTDAGRWKALAVAPTTLADQASYTVVANNTGTTAAPDAVAIDDLVVSDAGGYYDQTTLAGQLQEVRSDLAASSGSSLVGFLQAGTGAVARTVQSKERETVSVTDYTGVVADWNGTTGTDNAAGFQLAIGYIKTVGGVLKWPKGRYLIKSSIGTDQLNASDFANNVEFYFEPGCEIHYAPTTPPVSGQPAIALEGNNVSVTGKLNLTSDRTLSWNGDLPSQRTPYYIGVVIGGKSYRRLTQVLGHFVTGVKLQGVTCTNFNLPLVVYAAGDVEVLQNTVTDDTDTGILLDDCTSNLEVHHNTVRRSGDDCFFARHYQASAWVAAGNYVGTVRLHHNTLTDTFAKSFGFGGMADVDAHDNFSKNTWYAASNVDSSASFYSSNNVRIKIHDNIYIDPARAYDPSHPIATYRLPPADTTVCNAFHCNNGGTQLFTDIEFYDNIIVNPDQNGCSVGDTTRVSVRGNHFVAGRTTKNAVNRDTAGSGIRLNGCINGSIDGGNHIYGNGSQSWSWCYEISNDTTTSNIKIAGNAQEQFSSTLYRGISATCEAQTSYSGFSFYGTTAWAPGAIADNANETTVSISVPGAKLGDQVDVTFNQDLQGLLLTGYVSATGTVKAIAYNRTGGSVSLASGTLKALVTKRN